MAMGTPEQVDFLEIKGASLSPPALIHFNDNTKTIVHADASQIGLGGSVA